MSRRHVFFALAFLATATIFAGSVLKYRKIDTNHSTVAFSVPIAGGMSEVWGRFRDFSVEIDWVEEDPARSKVTGVIQAASIDTGISGRDEHLRGTDFFDTENHPTIRFESTEIVGSGTDYRLKGKFTMRGKTREIEFPCLVKKHTTDEGKVMLGFRADLTLDRQEYGVAWKHPDSGFVGDEVRVTLRILTKLRSPEET